MRLQSLLITLSIFAGIANAKEITHHCDKLQIINPQDSKVSLIAVPNSEFKIYDDLSAVVTIEGQVQERTAVEATPDQSVTPEMAAFILTSSGIEKTSAANIR